MNNGYDYLAFRTIFFEEPEGKRPGTCTVILQSFPLFLRNHMADHQKGETETEEEVVVEEWVDVMDEEMIAEMADVEGMRSLFWFFGFHVISKLIDGLGFAIDHQ